MTQGRRFVVGIVWRVSESAHAGNGRCLAQRGDLVIIRRVFGGSTVVTAENVTGRCQGEVFNTPTNALLEEVPPLVVLAELANG